VAASTQAYLRFPHVRGDVVTFVADDDVWLAPLAGGVAWRLSADRAPVSSPRLSPDGAAVAWTSRRHGAPEAYVSDISNGTARRLTYWGAFRTATRGWTVDAHVVVVSEAGQPAMSRTWAHALPPDGSPGRRLDYGIVDDVSFGPGGQVLTATSASYGRDPAWWKRYRGGTAARLWIDDDGSGNFAPLLPGHVGSLVYPMWAADRIFVCADHDGIGRLYTLDDAAPAGLREVAGHEFYVRHAATDGRTIVYVAGGELWSLDAAAALAGDAGPQRIEVRLSGARPGRQPYTVAAGEHRGAVAVDRTGRASAVEARGTVHWLAHRDGPPRALLAESGVRGRVPMVISADRVAYVSDAEGEDAVEVVEVGPGENARRRLAAGQLGRVLEGAAAPDGTKLALATADGRVLVLDVTGEEQNAAVRELDRSSEGEVTGLAWSPDSAWLAWSHPGPEPLRQLRMVRVGDGGAAEVVEATPLRFTDTDPAFTTDGQHLAFLSVRSLDPVYDAYVFDLAFPGGCRPCLLPLAARTASPFDPEVGGRPVQWPPGEPSRAAASEPAAGPLRPSAPEPSVPPSTEVDTAGLHQRVVPFPVPAARYRHLQAATGGLIWLRQPPTGELGSDLPTPAADKQRPALERYDLGARRCDVLVDEVDDAWVSADGTRVLVADRQSLRLLPADRRVPEGPDGDRHRVEVDLARLRLHIDPVREWHQMFDEAGRLMRDNFWRADMGGVAWDDVLARYRPLVARLGSRDDLVDLLWEVQGELGTSHAYVRPRPSPADKATQLGLLGADLVREGDGTWRVDRVVPGESSDPNARSPLAAPGVDVRSGDVLLAVDGQPVRAELGPAPLLVGTAGVPVELTVRDAAGDVRRVAVTPLADEIPLRYQDWVADRRRRTHELSGGRLGYLHVPDMVSTGWAQLHRDLRVEMACEGVIVDLRENRGGHTSELVVEKLARRVVGWAVARGYSPARYPTDAPRGPVVAIADEWAGSDGDIVSAAIQALGIGPVVGTRTWGGVVGIDMKYELVDGTSVTQPRYSFWLEGKGWGVENYGVDPDIEVPVTPQDRVAGRDPQLDTAVRVALDALERAPAAAPPQLPPIER
jgi:tricorn protease